ncbi:7397_t:CDS:1, partial [Racocetra persica]
MSYELVARKLYFFEYELAACKLGSFECVYIFELFATSLILVEEESLPLFHLSSSLFLSTVQPKPKGLSIQYHSHQRIQKESLSHR